MIAAPPIDKPQPVNPVLAVVMLMAGRYFQMLPDEPNPYRVPPSTPDDLRQWFDDVTGGPPRPAILPR